MWEKHWTLDHNDKRRTVSFSRKSFLRRIPFSALSRINLTSRRKKSTVVKHNYNERSKWNCQISRSARNFFLSVLFEIIIIQIIYILFTKKECNFFPVKKNLCLRSKNTERRRRAKWNVATAVCHSALFRTSPLTERPFVCSPCMLNLNNF